MSAKKGGGKSALIRLYMKVGVSAVVLIAAIFALLFNYDESTKKWAIGAISLVCGFWLRG